MKRIALVALLAACQAEAPPADRPAADSASAPHPAGSSAAAHAAAGAMTSYKALGTEPFWALEITSHGLRFRTPEDTSGIRFPPIEATRTGDTLSWAGETERAMLEARIWPAECSDGMSDREWTHAARVTVAGTTYTGCADPAPGLTAGQRPYGEWTIVDHRMAGVSAMSEAEATELHGRTITLAADLATSGSERCASPRYRYRTERADSVFASYNTSIAALGLQNSVDRFIGVTDVMCPDQDWPALGGRLLWTADGRPFTVFDGVFFELRRAGPPQPRT